MAESKRNQSPKPAKTTKKQSKATTGAWWKSPLLNDDPVEPGSASSAPPAESAPAESSEKKSSQPPPAAARAKRPSRRGSRKKKASNMSVDQPSTDQTTVAAKSGEGASAATSPVDPPAESAPRDSDAGNTRASEAAGESSPAGGESGGEPTKEERRSRRSRGRRGGRRKSGKAKKDQATPEQQGDSTDRAPEEGEDRAMTRSEIPSRLPEEDPELETESETEDDTEPTRPAGTGRRPVVKLLINAEEPEECRLALLEDGRLESLYVSTVGRVQTRNNIYKARVVAIEPNLQAAFVDYGTEKNGFLTFSEIHPEYYRQNLNAEVRALVEQQQWKKLSISDVLEKGQEMLVQVVKEEVGKKGANLTTYLSLPGRCVVLMPGSESEGVSRKISGEERRNELREIMNSLQIPEGIGWIVRTASIDITKTALTRDVRYLLRLWKEIKEKGQNMDGVGLLYQDHNCVMRFLREHFDPDIQEILVDDESALEKVEEFVEMLPAKQRTVKVKLHRGARPVFNHYSVEDQIESIYQPRVGLPSGGSIVIEPTEALVSIDVNSGSTGKGQNFEETIFQANMEAATELARQLRLRDLGGLIVVDFIDMRSSKHIREVEKQVKNAMKRDKAKVDITRISRFGLLQISRQKLGAPIESGNYRICDHCRGRGTVRSAETQALFYLRRIHTGASRKQVVKVNCRFPLDIAQYLLNNKRQDLLELEEQYQVKVLITADPMLKPLEHEIAFEKAEKEETGKKQA